MYISVIQLIFSPPLAANGGIEPLPQLAELYATHITPFGLCLVAKAGLEPATVAYETTMIPFHHLALVFFKYFASRRIY